MPQSNFRSIVLLGTLLIVAVLAVAYFFALPQWHNFSDSKVQLRQLNGDKDKLNQALSTLQTFLNSFQAEASNAETLKLAIPTKTADLSNFMSMFDFWCEGEVSWKSGACISSELSEVFLFSLII